MGNNKERKISQLSQTNGQLVEKHQLRSRKYKIIYSIRKQMNGT